MYEKFFKYNIIKSLRFCKIHCDNARFIALMQGFSKNLAFLGVVKMQMTYF